MTPHLHPDMAAVHARIDAVIAEASTLAAGLTHPQFNWRPAPDRWSVGECIAHLTVTARLFLPSIDRAIADGRARGLTGDGPFDYGWLQRWIIRAVGPPAKVKVKAPKSFQADGREQNPAACLTAFEHAHRDVQQRIAAAAGLHLATIIVPHPALPRLLKYKLGATFLIIEGHCRRHLDQARQVVQSPGFPAAR